MVETTFTVNGSDWDALTSAAVEDRAERLVVNMGPQHPSTHGGVLRLILEIEGETVTEARCGIGYLHTGIEKNLEYRTWTQGVTFVTRMDYLSPFFQRDRLLPRRRTTPRHHRPNPGPRQRRAGHDDGTQPHLQSFGGTGHRRHGVGGAMTPPMFFGFRERELILSVFEAITGLRMNNAYIRPRRPSRRPSRRRTPSGCATC